MPPPKPRMLTARAARLRALRAGHQCPRVLIDVPHNDDQAATWFLYCTRCGACIEISGGRAPGFAVSTLAAPCPCATPEQRAP